mgnify:CR=1 FL=1
MPGNSCGTLLSTTFRINILEDPQLERTGIARLIRRAFDGEVVDLPAILYDPNETIPGLPQDIDVKRWVSAIIYPLKAADGGVQQVALIHQDITGRRPERIRQAGVAIVPEGRRLLPDLTVEDNLRVASYALTRDQAQVGRDRVLELFPQLGQRLTAAARTLSGGEQQMVVLAQALITQPRYLLIDELSLGLAPVVVSRLIPVIAAVAESGTGVLLIEQFATVALGLAQQAHIMEGGRIRFSGLARELREQPELLSSAYLLRGSTAGPGTEQTR